MYLPVAGLNLLQETLGGWRCLVGSAGKGILYISFLRPVQSFRLCLLTGNCIVCLSHTHTVTLPPQQPPYPPHADNLGAFLAYKISPFILSMP
jgi:hypothetical protein